MGRAEDGLSYLPRLWVSLDPGEICDCQTDELEIYLSEGDADG